MLYNGKRTVCPLARFAVFSHSIRLEYMYAPMSNVMDAQPNIGGAVCESSVISFLVACRKFWLTPAARLPCSNAANIGERKAWMQSEFAPDKTPSGGKSPGKLYSVPAQETAKQCARFGWPPVIDVAAITKRRRQTR